MQDEIFFFKDCMVPKVNYKLVRLFIRYRTGTEWQC
jgi:hypothetical protein